jgi:tetratricopeptide (TPR) repeat protein
VYLGRALDLAPRPEGRYYAEVAMGAGGLAAHAGDVTVAVRHYEEALAVYRAHKDFVGIARVLDDLGLIGHKQGDFEGARRLYEESLAVARRVGDPRRVAAVLRNVALLELDAGQIERAEEYVTERLELGREIGDRRTVASALVSLARIVQLRDGWMAAKPHVEGAAPLFEAEHDLRGVALCLRMHGYGAQCEGDLAAAEGYYRSSLGICRAIVDYWGAGESLRYLSSHAERADRADEAKEYARQAEQLLRTTSDATGVALAQAQRVTLDTTPGDSVAWACAHATESGAPRPATGS